MEAAWKEPYFHSSSCLVTTLIAYWDVDSCLLIIYIIIFSNTSAVEYVDPDTKMELHRSTFTLAGPFSLSRRFSQLFQVNSCPSVHVHLTVN